MKGHLCRKAAALAVCAFLALPSGKALGQNEATFSLAEGAKASELIAYLKDTGRTEAVSVMTTANRFYPVFIFIPGIMGSKLEMEDPPAGSGKYRIIWGRMGLNEIFFDDDSLNYDPSQKGRIRATPLHEMEVMRQREDIYGEFIGTMVNLDQTGERHFFPFAYDWRQDNRISAQDFDAVIRNTWLQDLQARPVVVIAHSMGGLVFKWWYRNHYQGNEKDYGFTIDHVFFLGTPHSGSPAALEAICKGYSLLAKSGSWMQKVDQNTLSRALNNHGFTFPSIFQLIPCDDALALFVDEGIPNFRERPVNLFAADIWKRHHWPKRDILGVSREEFYGRLQPLLDSAKTFHDSLRQKPLAENAFYFFSFSHRTPTRLMVIRNEKGNIHSRVETKKMGGDGTVPTDIAKNWEKHPDVGRCISLTASHMDLPKDLQFLHFVDSFRDTFRAKRNEFLGREVARDMDLAQVFADKQIMLAMPVRRQATFQVDSMAIAKANNIIFALANPDLATPEQFDRQFYAVSRNALDPKTRSHLYATYIASETKVTGNGTIYKSAPVRMGWAANNLGHNLLLSNYWEDAGAYLKTAAEYTERLNIKNMYQDLKTKVKANRSAVARAVALEAPGPALFPGSLPSGG